MRTKGSSSRTGPPRPERDAEFLQTSIRRAHRLLRATLPFWPMRISEQGRAALRLPRLAARLIVRKLERKETPCGSSGPPSRRSPPLLRPAAATASRADSLAPHRVVYDLSLAKATGTRGVENARGRIAFDFPGDACKASAHLPPGDRARDRRGRAEDLRHAQRDIRGRRRAEFGSGPIPRRRAPRRKKLDGDAERRGDDLAVRPKQPKLERSTFGDEPLFPTDHMKRLIAAARAGENTFR